MSVLAICAHPDDETVGVGGTLLVHRARGEDVYWLIITKGHSPTWSADVIHAKEKEVEAVATAYGIKKYFWSALPSTLLDTVPVNDVIGEIRAVLLAVRPRLIYVVHHGDVHTDHQAVFRAATIVMKPFYMRRYGIERLLSFESISSTDAAPPLHASAFLPNVFQDITPYIDRKLEIMNMYATEAQPDPLPRGLSAIRALARYRGAMIGVEYAEAFMLIRECSP